MVSQGQRRHRGQHLDHDDDERRKHTTINFQWDAAQEIQIHFSLPPTLQLYLQSTCVALYHVSLDEVGMGCEKRQVCISRTATCMHA